LHPVIVSPGGCAFQFGLASPPTMPQLVPDHARAEVRHRDLIRPAIGAQHRLVVTVPAVHGPGRRHPHPDQQLHFRWRYEGSHAEGCADALIGFMAATAQAQAEATKAAQRSGIEHAKGKDHSKYLGRKPSYTRQQFTIRQPA
jgi:hypothetical protein